MELPVISVGNVRDAHYKTLGGIKGSASRNIHKEKSMQDPPFLQPNHSWKFGDMGISALYAVF